MTDFPIGLQLYSVRDDLAADFAGTLEKVKEMGYDGVEFAGLYGKSPAEVKKLCDEIGLIPISAHVPFAEMIADPEGVMADYALIGCAQIVIPYLTEDCRPGFDGFEGLIQWAKKLGALGKAQGMKQATLVSKMQLLGVDINPSSLSKLEGQTRIATDMELKAMAQILGVTMDELVKTEEEG